MKTHTCLKITIATLALVLLPSLPAQTTPNESSAKDSEKESAELQSMSVTVCYEAFSLPIAKAGELQRKGMEGEELYKEVVNTGKIERLLVLRTKSGQRAVLENISELKCPAEFNLSEHPIPQPLELKEKDRKNLANIAAASVSLIPMSFERREPGDTLETETTLSGDAKVVDGQISVSHVTFTKKEKWGKATVEFEQPQFEIQKLNTNFTAHVGSPVLIGTLNPPFGNGLATRTEQNVWFCFITTTVVQNNAAPQRKPVR